MGRASRRRRRDTYSRRRHELRERPGFADPETDWPPREPDDRDDVARQEPDDRGRGMLDADFWTGPLG